MRITDRVTAHAGSSSTVRPCLTVTLHVYASSEVELTACEPLRVDRMADAADEFAVECYGDLLPPGTTTLALTGGVYRFRAAHEVELRMDADAEIVVMAAPPRNTVPPVAPAVRAEGHRHVVVLGAADPVQVGRIPALAVHRD